MWDPNCQTCIEVNASGYTIEGVILQYLDDGLWHPIAFRSQLMAEAE